MFRVRADVKEVDRYLSRIERKQLPFATALGLTRTAQHVKTKTMRRVLPHIFDRPSPWVMPGSSPTGKKGGFYIIPATKRRLEAVVQIKDGVTRNPGRGGKVGTPAFDILSPHIKGGHRRAKRHEIALRRMGILGPDEYTVPGREMRLNRYGNLTAATYSKILADVNQTDTGGNDIAAGFGQRTTKRGRKRYFYHPNLKPRGIYQRTSRRRIRVALLFISVPQYRKRFDFDGISRRAAGKRWPIEFSKAMARALATAR